MLSGQMVNPYFPVRFDLVAAELRFEQLQGSGGMFGGAEVSTFALNHPGGACGYVVDAGDARVVYATDHEHGNAGVDAGLLEAARGADLLIYDAQFTPEEYVSHVGWGHGTWLEAARVAQAADVKQLVLFHHDPAHSDEMMHEILGRARDVFPRTSLAIEGKTFSIAGAPGTAII